MQDVFVTVYVQIVTSSVLALDGKVHGLGG